MIQKIEAAVCYHFQGSMGNVLEQDKAQFVYLNKSQESSIYRLQLSVCYIKLTNCLVMYITLASMNSEPC